MSNRAYTIACRSKTHSDAVAAILAEGLAEDAAEADALIYEGLVRSLDEAAAKITRLTLALDAFGPGGDA